MASALLLLLASVQFAMAAWYYEKENVVVAEGTVHPGGFTSTVVTFDLNAGEEAVKNATVHAIIPERSNVTFYFSKVVNGSALENYNATVILGSQVVGTITPSQNISVILEQGEYDITFEIHLKAAVSVENETTFEIWIGVRAEAA